MVLRRHRLSAGVHVQLLEDDGVPLVVAGLGNTSVYTAPHRSVLATAGAGPSV